MTFQTAEVLENPLEGGFLGKLLATHLTVGCFECVLGMFGGLGVEVSCTT